MNTARGRGKAPLGAEEIRALRKSLGWSQARLGEAVGVTQATISNWETGRSEPLKGQHDKLRAITADNPGAPLRDPSESPEASYGDWLTSARLEKGWTRQQLAAKAGISEPQIWNIETGRTLNPRRATKESLERALGATPPDELVKAVEEQAQIGSVGTFTDFDPHVDDDLPSEPGIYVFYDVSDRPVYVGQSTNIRSRIKEGHQEKFWFRSPIVEKASYVRVEDQHLRRQLEDTLIKFLKSNAVINQRQVRVRR